eukprot:m.33649 g.33649  ORF g.33649 m.33649 type:complete len:1140 (+) comp16851_c1_seq1:87-3506(+)
MSTPRISHVEGQTTVLYSSAGTHYITAGADGSIRIFEGFTDEEPAQIEHSSSPVHGIALKSDQLATALDDHTVNLFNYTKGNPKQCKFESICTRFTLPVKHVCYNATGSTIAAAGDDAEIKVVSLINMSAKTMRGHDGAIRSLTFDPEGVFIASSSSDGSVRVWNLSDATCTKTLSILPRSADSLFKMDWHPNGKYIAIPVKNRVCVYERDSWDEIFSFGGDEGHNKDVVIAEWSPNGEYLASVSSNGEIIVWSTNDRQTLARFKHKESVPICSVAWHPKGNEIAWADTHGKFCIWKEPIPEASQFSLPTGGVANVDETEAAQQNLASLFPDDDEDEAPTKRKRIKKVTNKKLDDSDDDEDFGDGIERSVPLNEKLDSKSKKSSHDNDDDDSHYVPAVAHAEALLQAPFQPSSTPVDEARRILVWNSVGVITSREEDVSCSVDVEFHNVSKHKPIRMIDHFGFTVAALSETCFVMAAPIRIPSAEDERDNPSVLFCRNFDHWATDDTWQIRFPEGEEIEGVAAGGGTTGFVACTTNKNYVRIYSTTGIPKHIMCLEGPSLAISAKDEQFFVVYHQAATPGAQVLGYVLFDLDQRRVIHKERLPISYGAELNWIGFTDDGLPACVDSEEIVRVLLQDWGFTWSPILEMKLLAKNPTDSHWITSITEQEVMCVVCKGGDTYPKVLPRPIMSSVPLRLPLVSLNDTLTMEENFLRSKINYEQTVRIDELDENDEEDNHLMLRAQQRMDKHILSCISRAVQSQKPGRALDLTTYLNASKSIDIAIKLAVKAKFPMLAERMMTVKQGHHLKVLETKYAKQTQQLQLQQLQTPVHQQQVARVSNIRQVNTFLSPPSSTLRGKPTASTAPKNFLAQRKRKPEIEEYQEDVDMHDNDDEYEIVESPTVQKPRAKTTLPPAKRQAVANTTPLPSSKNANPFAKATKAASVTPISELGRGDTKTDTKKAAPKMMFLKQMPASKPKKTKDPNAPKKPLSAYMLWLCETRESLKEEFKEVQPKVLLKKAGEKWNSLADDEKNKWNDVAAEKKEEWKKAVEEYENKKNPKKEAVAVAEEEIDEKPSAADDDNTDKDKAEEDEEEETQPLEGEVNAHPMDESETEVVPVNTQDAATEEVAEETKEDDVAMDSE